MNQKQIQAQGSQTKTNQFFRINQTKQSQATRQDDRGANKSFKIAVYHHAYNLWRALRVLASAADTGEAIIAPDKNALWITTYDWIKTKAAVLKILRENKWELIEYNPDAIGRYYVVNVWEFYEAVDGMISSNERLSTEDVTIGVEDDTGEKATLYVEIDGRRERLNARRVGSRRTIPSFKPAASVWIYVKPFFGALTRARRAGAKYVNITITPDGLRIKGGKYVTEVGGDIIVPEVIKGNAMQVVEGIYPMDVLYDVVSHSAEFNMLQVSMTADRLLYFDYTLIKLLTAYIMPVY